MVGLNYNFAERNGTTSGAYMRINTKIIIFVVVY